MRLSAGTRLGPYEIVAPLGAGGMGEVYRARDTRLVREVAIKVLPEEVAGDARALARFETEARAVAALSHPNILALFDVGKEGAVSFVVTELLEGETLRQLLARGPVPVRRALDIGLQVAEGLAAAHEKGVVHRDVKPENIFLTKDGHAKLLDFGLARHDVTRHDPIDTRSPTLAAMSEKGVVLGTVAYMSPEQARGETVDFRSDQFSLGTVLYEMLAGRRPFAANSVPETLTAIIREDARPLESAAPNVPAPVRWLVERCLSKEPDGRYASSRDLARDLSLWSLHLSDVAPSSIAAAGGVGRRLPMTVRHPVRLLGVTVLLAGVASGVAVWVLTRPSPKEAPYGYRFNLTLPDPGTTLCVDETDSVAISPDGTRVAFAAVSAGRRQIYLRQLSQLEATPVPGTSGGGQPFFSPDGEWLGFNAEGKLKKIPVKGGEPTTLCDAPSLRGASWGTDGTIVFCPSSYSGLMRIPAAGGTPRTLTEPNPQEKQISHRWPTLLPGGKAALFDAMAGDRVDDHSIAVVSLETGQWRVLVQGGSFPRYSGRHIFFVRARSLVAAPFGAKDTSLTGPSVPVLDDVRTSFKTSTGVGFFDVSETGVLVFVPGQPPPDRALLWVDREGKAEPLTQIRKPYANPALSPDGTRLAVTVEGANDDIWVLEIGRDSWIRLTFEADNYGPVWAPDGKRVAFSSNRARGVRLFWILADGSGPPEPLSTTEHWCYANSFSPDGKLIVFRQTSPATRADLLVRPVDGAGPERVLLSTPFNEGDAVLSPDGRWYAYVSDESGRSEVYVRAFPGPGRKWPISGGFGIDPAWARSGRELFYRSGDRFMVVSLTTQPAFAADAPRILFEKRFHPIRDRDASNFAVSADGRRFIVVSGPETETAPAQLVVAPDWLQEISTRLRKRQQ
jgi:Tol biopolymer transport system component